MHSSSLQGLGLDKQPGLLDSEMPKGGPVAGIWTKTRHRAAASRSEGWFLDDKRRRRQRGTIRGQTALIQVNRYSVSATIF
jgi:hypothetical protein